MSEKEYAYTTGNTSVCGGLREDRNTDGTWKDKLMKWGNTAMTYDAVGNMIADRDLP